MAKERSKKMKNILCAIIVAAVVLASAGEVLAWDAEGLVPGTEIAYSGLSVSKKGVSVKLTNTSSDDVKVSLKLTFFDERGNSAGHSIFGLREIPAGESVEISGNHLSGKWKPCRDSVRIDFSKMTYEPIYF
jgi:hypothetical protein